LVITCTTGCDTKRFSCAKSAFKCSDLCNCTKCENTSSADDDNAYEYDDGVDDYDEYEEVDQLFEDELLLE
jgi:hypothetical protein